jgi:hypothetical protein
MTPSSVPPRHWRTYGNDPLPTGEEALNEPLRAFPSWLLRIECELCSEVRIVNEADVPNRLREMPIRDLLAWIRHHGCGGRATRAELLTGIEGVSSRPVRRIVLIAVTAH